MSDEWLPSFAESFCTALGVVVPMMCNYALKRPFLTGPQYHIIGAAIGYGIGHQATRIMDEVQRKNLLHMEDYMRQYPERFADLQPSDKKWKDVIQDWHPYR